MLFFSFSAQSVKSPNEAVDDATFYHCQHRWAELYLYIALSKYPLVNGSQHENFFLALIKAKKPQFQINFCSRLVALVGFFFV